MLVRNAGHFQFLDDQSALQRAICAVGPVTDARVRAVAQARPRLLLCAHLLRRNQGQACERLPASGTNKDKGRAFLFTLGNALLRAHVHCRLSWWRGLKRWSRGGATLSGQALLRAAAVRTAGPPIWVRGATQQA